MGLGLGVPQGRLGHGGTMRDCTGTVRSPHCCYMRPILTNICLRWAKCSG